MYCVNKTYSLICDCCWVHLENVEETDIHVAMQNEENKYEYKTEGVKRLGFGWVLEAERVLDSGITGWIRDGAGHLCPDCAKRLGINGEKKSNTGDIRTK